MKAKNGSFVDLIHIEVCLSTTEKKVSDSDRNTMCQKMLSRRALLVIEVRGFVAAQWL